jgi:hypothetical protein
MSSRKKEQKLAPVSNVLKNILATGKSPLAQQFRRWQIWQNWPQIVGPSIAAYSDPVGYVKGTLFIWVQSAAHMQEMSFALDPIRRKVNQFVGDSWAKTIRLTLDRKSVPVVADVSSEVRDYIADPGRNADRAAYRDFDEND